jgi:hypothetical protein
MALRDLLAESNSYRFFFFLVIRTAKPLISSLIKLNSGLLER